MRRTKTIGTLTAAAVGLGLATAGVTAAHPPGGPGDDGAAATNGPRAGNGPQAEGPRAGRGGPRGMRGRRGIARRCNIADDQLLDETNNDRLRRIRERLNAKVPDDLTQARADRIFARRQKMVTIRVTMRTAMMEPVLALGLTKAELRDARENHNLRELLESKTPPISVEQFRAARREGRRDARAAVRELCNFSNGAAGGGTAPAYGPSA